MSASKPTWNPSSGSSLAPTLQYSSRDLKAHSQLKVRHDLVAKEAPDAKEEEEYLNSAHLAEADATEVSPQKADKFIETEDIHREKLQESEENANHISEDENGLEAENDNSDDDNDEDEEEDDTEALLLEMEKIKKERELAKQEQEQVDLETKTAKAMSGNPLYSQNVSKVPDDEDDDDFVVKRKWYDDTVFRGQSTSEKPKKRFINDTLRSDFHKQFLNRFVR